MVQQTVSKLAAQSGGESFRSQFLSSPRPTVSLSHPPQLAMPVSTHATNTSLSSIKPDNQAQDSLPIALSVKLNRQARRAAMFQGVDISGDGYLRLKEVLSVYPVSRATWYQGIERGIYPKQINLGKRSVAWTRESIRNLIANPPKF